MFYSLLESQKKLQKNLFQLFIFCNQKTEPLLLKELQRLIFNLAYDNLAYELLMPDKKWDLIKELASIDNTIPHNKERAKEVESKLKPWLKPN
jgi:hypothetical protein